MNSRQRVKAVLEGKTPDVIPTDLWGCASRLKDELYLETAKILNLTPEKTLIRPGTVTQYEDYTLADALGCDFRHINIKKPKGFKSYKNEQGLVIDEWGVGRDVSADYPTVVLNPLKDATIEEILQYNWPNPFDEGRIEGIAEQAKNWFENTDKAITATAATSGLFFELAQYLRGAEQLFMDMCLEPELIKTLINKITEILIDINLCYLKPIAPYIEWVEFTSDLGTQNAPFISPDMFKEFFFEPFKLIFSTLKSAYPNIKVLFHSCGSIYEFIPMLIEAGVDVLNPIQPLAKNMDPQRIKEMYGDKLVFHGGIDIQRAMPSELEDVEREVKLRIDQMGKGGGYILSASNHMMDDIPAANVIAMYKTAKEYGKYS